MRYFKMMLGTSEQQIKENSKVKLNNFSYDSPIAAVNGYMHKTMRNGLSFLIYRTEENGSALAGFSFDEKHIIVQEMENHRDNVIVIFAGYPTPMKQFLDRNPGLLSRIAFQVEFEDYTVDELCAITNLMLSRKEMVITDAAMDKLKAYFESVIGSNDYGNGRFARKMLEEAEMNLSERVLQLKEEELTTAVLTMIEESDIPEIIGKESEKKRTIGFAA